MDDDIFMTLDVINAKKLRKEPQIKQLPVSKKKVDEFEIPQPLTTKLAVKFLLEGRLKSKVCRYCLNVTPGLSELDQIMKIGGTGNIYKVTIRDIVASFHPFKVVDDPNFPNKICQKCIDKALGAYLFTQQCERAERAMLNCFDDMYEKFEKLDPIDRPKKRGRQKLNPNFNILHAAHHKVIDYAEPIIHIVNSSAEAITTEPELNDLECKKCWQVLPNLESLINHEKIHPKTMWYHCRLCGKSFPKSNQLRRHNNRVHILGKEPTPHPDKDFKCNECCHVTDNFIQHLQHIEKHKFKNIMKHLIEKKMDKLCVVCYNKGTKMTDLDRMVCVHGCHPDLMGDKTLYTLLATTLPDPKSYKYQDLCLPCNAPIMTVTKKQNSYLKRKANEMEPAIKIISINEDFQFSNPIIISRKCFKTNHFYCYVFCDPEFLVNVDANADNMSDPEVVETNDIEDDNLSIDTSSSNEEINVGAQKITSYDLNVEGIAEIAMANFLSTMYGVVGQDCTRKSDTIVTEITETNQNLQNQKFCSHDLLNDNLEYTNVLPIASQYKFSKHLPESLVECSESLTPAVIKKTSNKLNVPQNIFSNPSHESLGEVSKSAVMQKMSKKPIVSNPLPESVREWSESFNPSIMSQRTDVPKNIFSNLLFKTVEEFDVAHRFDIKEAEKVTNANEKLTKELDQQLILDDDFNDYKKQDKKTKRDEDIKCNFCWIFSQIGLCGYCERPIKGVERNPTAIKDTSTDKVPDTKKKQLEEKKTWQCIVCLINNNAERLTCQCCGNMKLTEHSDVKIKFGNNETFQRKETKNEEDSFPKESNDIIQSFTSKNEEDSFPKESNDNIQSFIINLDKTIVTEEPCVMDCKSSSEDDKKLETVSMITMDTDIATFTETTSDMEAMDVEESPIITNESLNLNNQVLNFNIQTIMNPVATSIIGPNLQFNMGSGSKNRSLKKKSIRNTSKAMHK